MWLVHVHLRPSPTWGYACWVFGRHAKSEMQYPLGASFRFFLQSQFTYYGSSLNSEGWRLYRCCYLCTQRSATLQSQTELWGEAHRRSATSWPSLCPRTVVALYIVSNSLPRLTLMPSTFANSRAGYCKFHSMFYTSFTLRISSIILCRIYSSHPQMISLMPSKHQLTEAQSESN
jgi:hypothetical protein